MRKGFAIALVVVPIVMAMTACAPVGPAPTRTSWPSAPSNGPSGPANLPESEPGTPDASPGSEESGKGESVIRPDKEPEDSGTDVVVDELLDRGWRYHQQGDHDRALAVAERAQGIAPRHPESYLLMASSQLALYRNGVAEQLARRGLSLSRAGTEVNRRLRTLLAEITAMR